MNPSRKRTEEEMGRADGINETGIGIPASTPGMQFSIQFSPVFKCVDAGKHGKARVFS